MKKSILRISCLLPFTVISFFLLNGCAEDAPVTPDGGGIIEIMSLGDISLNNDSIHYVPMANAKAYISSEYGVFEKQTDEYGILKLENLPSAVYSINIRMNHPDNPYILITGNLMDITIGTAQIHRDTLRASQISGTGIAISEVYSVGSPNDIYYYFDQFIELYNYSDETIYLDGMIVSRFANMEDFSKGAGADDGDDGDIDGLSFASKFPGNPGEKNYPFEPRTYKVLAVQPIDHRKNIPTSVDLSKADWEFYNQHSTTDFDYTNIPNLINMLPHKTTDFYLNLSGDIIILASGTDQNLSDGLDISSVLDGMQYRVSPSYPPTIDSRIDKSTIVTPLKYSGKSIQRREPDMDTNNGRLDWTTVTGPTPGRL